MAAYLACQSCRPAWEAAVYNGGFFGMLGSLLLPVAVIGVVVFALARFDREDPL